MQGIIRDKIANGTVIWKKKSVCLALSMNYNYSKGGKSEHLPKRLACKGTPGALGKGYNALLVR